MRYLTLWVWVLGCHGQPQLSETTQLVVVVSPGSQDFGSVTVNQTSAVGTVTVSPASGPQNDVIDSVTESCNDFEVTALGLPAAVYRTCLETCTMGQICPATAIACQTDELVTYQFSATFRPSVPGPQSCAVSISLNGGATIRTAMLSGTGLAPPIDIDVQPGSIAFGDVRIATTSSPANVAVRNLGGAELTVSSVSVSAGYTLGGPTAFAVPAGGAQNLTVTCTPAGVGPLGGSLVIGSNDPSTPSVTVPLQCAGVSSNLDISPSPAVLAPTRVGEPQVQSISIVNSGGASTTITDVGLVGAGLTITSPSLAGAVLPSGGSADVTIAFDALARGPASGTLTVVTSDGTRTSQITATALLASMALDPDGSLDLGPVCIGQTAEHTFTVLGNGDGGFQLASISISDPGLPFTLETPSLPAQVQASGANQVTFTVRAAPEVPGEVTSQLAIATDIPGGAPRLVDLRVEGLTAGVSATPAELDLGSFVVDETTIAAPITVTNCSAAAVELSTARIEGTHAADFAIVVQPTSLPVSPGGSATWLVVLSPRSVGLKEATLLVDHPDGTTAVALFGEGLGETVAGEPRTTSYYSCSAGGPTAAWPLLLLGAFALRPRKRRG